MRTFTRFLSFVAVLAMLAPSAWAQGGNVPTKVRAALLNNSAQGTEFYIAIPANEVVTFPTRIIEFYITSSKNTNVTVEAPGLGYTRTKPVKAMDITTFGTDDGIGSNFEVRESGVTPYGLRITADQPISVYVLNAKTTTSEGYLALPVSVWGKENIHCSYYDFGELGPWGGGFLVLASQDNTFITVKLKGKGFGKTVSGNKIGDVVTKTLNKGDVFNMRGDAATVGSFDITGTTITSNKPVGLISYHMRTMIPAIAQNNGRDHLAEMIPPTSAWGKNFVSAEYQRKGNGDQFRAVAKEDGTIVTGVWYDKATRQKIGQKQWLLNKAGQFEQSMYASTSPGGQDIRGYSVWTSNKPILLMQYSYSANWDGDPLFDPFMIVVPPLEQYIQGTVFQTPSNAAFVTNWFNILAVGDSTDPDHKLLKTVKLDGKYIYQTHPQFLLQRIPTTNIYYVPIDVAPDAHRVESETKFAGFIYGFSSFDSYGWPAAMAINKIDDLDTNEPELKVVQECSIFKITATEIRNGKPGDDPLQVESGVSRVAMVEDESFNFDPEPDPANFANDPKVIKHDFTWKVTDPTKDARLVYDVVDLAGNVNRDTIDYIADKLSITPDPVDFLKVRVGTSKNMDVMLKNNGTDPVAITKVSMAKGTNYQVVNPLDGFTLAPGEEKAITIRYSPTEEYITKKPQYDLDSLIVQTTCTRFPWEVIGRGVMPKIQVGDFDAGTRPVNDKLCLDKGLMIANIGTEALIVNADPQGVAAPFTFTNTDPMLPVTIQPGDTIWLKEICFVSDVIDVYTQDITFSSNAMAGDSVSNWKGRTTNSELIITDKNWYERRVGTIHDSVIVLFNTGNAEVQVTDIALKNPADNNFRITKILPYDPRVGGAVPLGAKDSDRDSMWIYVQFEPESLGSKSNLVVAKYISAKGNEQIEGKLDGIGILPVIQGNEIDFSNDCQDPTEVNETDAQQEVFTVTNTGDMPLTITRIELTNANGNFSWADQAGDLRTDVSVATPLVLQPNDSETYNLTFTPSAVGPTSATIEVDGDTRTGTNAAETHEWDIKGCGFAPGLEFLPLTATNLLCDNPVGTLTIRNTGGSEINITAVPTVEEDPNFPGENAFFSIANQAAFPTTITPGGNQVVEVQFNPMTEKTYHAKIVVQTSNGPISTSVTWTATRVNAKFALSNAATPLKLTDQVDVFINGESNSWNQVGASSFEAKLIYNPKEMEYNGTISAGTATPNWTITPSAPVKLADGRHSMTITGNGPAPIGANGTLAKINMQTFLTPSQLYQMQVEMSLNDRDKCVIIDTAGSSVNIEDCFAEGRAVNIGSEVFMLRSINPNPATGGTIEVEYSVGFTAHTRVELYNSLGELVKVVADGVQEAGDYKVRVETEKLSSGIYHCRMVSGPYSTTKSMIISE